MRVRLPERRHVRIVSPILQENNKMRTKSIQLVYTEQLKLFDHCDRII